MGTSISRRFPKATILAGLVTLFGNNPAESLMLESPRGGEAVIPGQTVWVSVQPTSATETSVRHVRVLAPAARGCENLPAILPAQCMLTLPHGANVRETIDIQVRAVLENGTETVAAVSLSILPAQGLVALQSDPRQNPIVFDFPNQEKRLSIVGLYADGSTRDLFSRVKGTTYAINDPAIAEVHADGRIIARNPGSTTVTVRNGSLSVDVAIIVQDSVDPDS